MQPYGLWYVLLGLPFTKKRNGSSRRLKDLAKAIFKKWKNLNINYQGILGLIQVQNLQTK